MKTSIIAKVLTIVLITILFVSCRSSRVSNERRRYPTSSHRTRTVRNMPPGHAKKVYGDQSAREYSPGHQKKHGNKYKGAKYGKAKKHKHGKK